MSHPSHHHGGGEAVPQHVRRDLRLYACLFATPRYGVGSGIGGSTSRPAVTGKKGSVGFDSVVRPRYSLRTV